MKRLVFNFFLICFLFGSTATFSQQRVEVSKYFGTFIGVTKDAQTAKSKPLELRVSIEAQGRDGFQVEWSTVDKNNGEVDELSTSSVIFKPTNRSGIYGSAMKTDVFGNRIPLNPLSGDPFVWATLSSSVLRIHQLIISDDGGYELKLYKRSLDQKGLEVQFARYRDGERQSFTPVQMTREKE